MRQTGEQRTDSFTGIDNTSAEDRLAPGALREARNVDLDGDGKLRRRRGRTLRLALLHPHSLFGDAEFPFLLLRQGADLCALDEDLTLERPVLGGLGDEPASYCVLNGEVLWTVRGRRSGRLDSLLNDLPLGLPGPPGVPALAALPTGEFTAGGYRVALSYLDADGEESGTCDPAPIALAAGQGLQVTLPTPPPGIAWVRVYLSEPDGTTLYAAAQLPAGTSMAVLSATSPRGNEALTLGLEPLPPGQLIRELNGVLYVAQDRVLWHGKPMRPRLHDPATDFIPFAADIDIVQPVGDGTEAGLFVCAGKRTYYLNGAFGKDFRIRTVRTKGGVPGTGLMVRGDLLGRADPAPVAYWMGADGRACLGLPGGSVQVLAPTAAMTQFAAGTSLLREVDGVRQFVTAGENGPIGAFAASDTAEVFHYRNGLLLP